MKRNDVVTLDRLSVGDRFYKVGDNSKTMLQVMDTEKQVRTVKQKHFACPVSFLGTNSETNKTVPMMGNIQVVFLRNIDE
ncbi:hypothetical protein [Pedobacter sp. WC2423]|uniref:hypothetical protein n=1 Tax=Pedobacter sp. WC2423 TaxID=3234142 RepID=UPI0034662B8F